MMDESTSEKCLICFESLTDYLETGLTVEKTECEHVFHSHCLSEWFRIGVPGNYCPFCRSGIPGMEAVTSEAEEDESEQSFSDSDSEESIVVSQEQLDQMSEEDFQSYLQTSLGAEEELIERQDMLTNIRTRLVGIQELLSKFTPTTSSEQQEKFDKIHEMLSVSYALLDLNQRILDHAWEIASRASQPLDRSTLIGLINHFKDLKDSVEQNNNNVMVASERMFSMDTLQNLTMIDEDDL